MNIFYVLKIILERCISVFKIAGNACC